jgi:hypothetical protein
MGVDMGEPEASLRNAIRSLFRDDEALDLYINHRKGPDLSPWDEKKLESFSHGFGVAMGDKGFLQLCRITHDPSPRIEVEDELFLASLLIDTDPLRHEGSTTSAQTPPAGIILRAVNEMRPNCLALQPKSAAVDRR